VPYLEACDKNDDDQCKLCTTLAELEGAEGGATCAALYPDTCDKTIQDGSGANCYIRPDC
jgi:hypothetical protein